jgi:Holliday junction resolvase-like predicted endonuclease
VLAAPENKTHGALTIFPPRARNLNHTPDGLDAVARVLSKPVNDAERRAARWYRLRGYRILGTNVWAAGYEVDLIARRGRRLVFCEVKSKSAPGFGDPLEMVTPEKVRRVRRAAQAWLAQNRRSVPGCYVTFDVVVERAGRLQRLPEAF